MESIKHVGYTQPDRQAAEDAAIAAVQADPENYRAIFEGQLSRPAPSIAKIGDALGAGAKVEIVAVHALPESALENTLLRFQGYGRGASIHVIAQIQGGLADGLLEIRRHFGDTVVLRIADYRDRKRSVLLVGWNHLDVLRSEGTYEIIKQRLSDALEARRPLIGEAAYRQAKGLAPLDADTDSSDLQR